MNWLEDTFLKYSRNVYLCVSKELRIFECLKFKSFLEANEYYKKNLKKSYPHSAMIPISKLFMTEVKIAIIEHELKEKFRPYIFIAFKVYCQ